MDFEPVAVFLKFGFIAVLYLFLLWVSRSALKDLRRTALGPAAETGIHLRPSGGDRGPAEAWLVVERGDGLEPGERFELIGGLTLGRSSEADVRLGDPYASQIHARLYSHAGTHYVEDMRSTNGTYLNAELVRGPEPLSPNDRLRIGESELRYEAF